MTLLQPLSFNRRYIDVCMNVCTKVIQKGSAHIISPTAELLWEVAGVSLFSIFSLLLNTLVQWSTSFLIP
jgi:hypothetical protein